MAKVVRLGTRLCALDENQRDHGLMGRVRRQNERRALAQAKRVPLKTLNAAVEDYTIWEVFTLWLRAVVTASRRIPADFAREMKSRGHLFIERNLSRLEKDLRDSTDPGAEISLAVSSWAERHVFLVPRQAGWLDAVRYFSSSSIHSMKAWSYWESMDQQWRVASPEEFPTFAQWQCQVLGVTTLHRGNVLAQQVLETVRRLPQPEWNGKLMEFFDLIAFLVWMELVFDVEGSASGIVGRELEQRYSGFELPTSCGPKQAVRTLYRWNAEYRLADSHRRELLAALSFHVRYHPAYAAMRSYAQHCHDQWTHQRSHDRPSFEEWREAADEYFER